MMSFQAAFRRHKESRNGVYTESYLKQETKGKNFSHDLNMAKTNFFQVNFWIRPQYFQCEDLQF